MSNILNSNSHFSRAPQVSVSRSRFDRPSRLTTTFNAGSLIPIYIDEVLPGDTFSINEKTLCRMATPLYPVMDNAYLDTYYFYVPNRILWSHWKAFMGENTSGPWTQTTEYNVPMITYATDDNNGQKPCTGTLWDYFGLPASGAADDSANDAYTHKVNALPFRAYVAIWNEFFRDENIDNPAYFYDGDANLSYKTRQAFGTGGISSPLEYEKSVSLEDKLQCAILGGFPLPVNKFHDYFTSCLPQPQKGNPVNIFNGSQSVSAVQTFPNEFSADMLFGFNKSVEDLVIGDARESFPDEVVVPLGQSVLAHNEGVARFGSDTAVSTSDSGYYPANLGVALNQFNLSINELRVAFQMQKLLEAEARGGTRYRELLYSIFGVVSPDSTQQVPEYLCGARHVIGMQQVVQTSESGDVSPQGNVAAYSVTFGNNHFTKSFTEHGYIIGVACVRTNNTYQNTCNKLWARRSKYDFYFPQLANIGEQPVYKAELMVNNQPVASDGDPFYDSGVFGYQEAWAEYRYRPSYVTGQINSNAAQSLDSWTYAQDYYGTIPTLSAEWLKQGVSEIDRTLAVTSSQAHQFILDCMFECTVTRPMPMYSIPGLADHH